MNKKGSWGSHNLGHSTKPPSFQSLNKEARKGSHRLYSHSVQIEHLFLIGFFISFIHPPIHLFTLSSIHLSVHPSIHTSVRPSIHPPIHLFIRAAEAYRAPVSAKYCQEDSKRRNRDYHHLHRVFTLQEFRIRQIPDSAFHLMLL